MFRNSKIKILQDEVKHLREMNQKLVDRLVSLQSLQAYGAVQHAEAPDTQVIEPSEQQRQDEYFEAEYE